MSEHQRSSTLGTWAGMRARIGAITCAFLATACAASAPGPDEGARTDSLLAALAPLGVADVVATDGGFVLVGPTGDDVGDVTVDADGVIVARLDGHEARMLYSADAVGVQCDGSPVGTDTAGSTLEPGSLLSATDCAAAIVAANILLNVDASALPPVVDDVAGAQEALEAFATESEPRSVVCGFDPTTFLGFCYDTSGNCSNVNGVYLGSPCLGTGGVFLCRRTCSSLCYCA